MTRTVLILILAVALISFGGLRQYSQRTLQNTLAAKDEPLPTPSFEPAAKSGPKPGEWYSLNSNMFGYILGVRVLQLPDLLKIEEARHFLRLTPDQIAELEAIEEERNHLVEQARAEYHRRNESEEETSGEGVGLRIRERMEKRSALAERERAVLTDDQLLLSKQLVNQLNGEYLFATKGTAAELKISDQQRGTMNTAINVLLPQPTPEELELAQHLKEIQQRHNIARLEGKTPESTEEELRIRFEGAEFYRRQSRIVQDAHPQLLVVLRECLTSEQLTEWQAMQGPPIDAEILATIRAADPATKSRTSKDDE